LQRRAKIEGNNSYPDLFETYDEPRSATESVIIVVHEESMTASSHLDAMILPKKRDPRILVGNEELAMLLNYSRQLQKYGASEKALAILDLENVSGWLPTLIDDIAFAYDSFDQVNSKFFGGKYTCPRIKYARRATGGYYDRRKHEIGISMAMTIEFGRPEFLETLLHEFAHFEIQAHNQCFYDLLEQLGGSGRKAPRTYLLELKRNQFVLDNYPVLVHCPNCLVERRYRNRRALRYACKACCQKFAGGKFDTRFQLVLKTRTVRTA
jgi:predicted SprT family Zn-dependent metalloprotease